MRDDTVGTLYAGETIAAPGVGELVVEHVAQRNWSVVARAVDRNGASWFLKQFVDRVGTAHPRGFAGEGRTREMLDGVGLPDLEIVPVISRIDHRLVMVSPHLDLTTIDSIDVARPSDLRAAERVGGAIADVLGSRRLPTDDDCVSVWKGLDPKNIGWDAGGRLWVFDFGPPVELRLGEAASRVVAAGLLSRWVARPGLHVVWPERSILRAVCGPVAPFTSFEDVDRHLRQNHELRMREPQRKGYGAPLTRLGLQTLGRVYWWSARREARRLFATPSR